MWRIPFTIWSENYYGQGRADSIFEFQSDTKEQAIAALQAWIARDYPGEKLEFDEADIKFQYDDDDYDYDRWYEENYEWDDDDLEDDDDFDPSR